MYLIQFVNYKKRRCFFAEVKSRKMLKKILKLNRNGLDQFEDEETAAWEVDPEKYGLRKVSPTEELKCVTIIGTFYTA